MFSPNLLLLTDDEWLGRLKTCTQRANTPPPPNFLSVPYEILTIDSCTWNLTYTKKSVKLIFINLIILSAHKGFLFQVKA